MRWLMALAAVGCMHSSALMAQEIVGAKEALRIYGEKSKQLADAGPRDESLFGEALAEYRRSLPDLDPDDAAAGWLATYDAWRTSQSMPPAAVFSIAGVQETPWARLLSALPGPRAWGALHEQVQQRPLEQQGGELITARALRLLTSRLVGDEDAMRAELDAIDRVIEDADAPADGGGVVNRILQGLDGPYGNQEPYAGVTSAVKGFRATLSDDPVGWFVAELETDAQASGEWFGVPNLVPLVGRERATELLLRVFKGRTRPSFGEDDLATIGLARELASEHIDELAFPPWGLCLSTEAGSLFEQLLERFGDDHSDPEMSRYVDGGYTYSRAASFYFRGLILRGEDEAATELFAEHSMDSDTVEDLFVAWYDLRETAEERQRVYDFLVKLARSHPDVDVWNHLITTAAQLGCSADVRLILDRLLSQRDLEAGLRTKLEALRADALLAAGDIVGAVEQLRKSVNDIGEPKTPDDFIAVGLIAGELMRVGRLADQRQWVAEGVAIADKLFEIPVPQQLGDGLADYMGSPPLFELYCEELIRQQRAGRVESLLIDRAAGQIQSYGAGPAGTSLAELYLRLERYDDVITLLNEATWWPTDDLAATITRAYPLVPVEKTSLALIAAEALAETGEPELARRIAERVATVNPGNDTAWSLLAELAGDDFPDIANSIFRRDPFEERPLIWLAQHQLKARQVEEAERTIRRAIAIDPSDGEQGKGDRMRAYAVLADILAAKNDEQADKFREVVRAIRMSEDADDLINAGMFTDGIALFHASLEKFADAYCIQSRLALQLAAQGDFEAAARHYQRAFELMPDSFGRVESHCFGCEGAFDGELASTIADRVFGRLAQERPDDPKVQYLIGYLRSSQGLHDEAVVHYQRATELDPEYLNAWINLLESAQVAKVSRDVSDNAAFNVFRLAPIRSPYSGGLESVRDLRRLWDAAEDAAQRIPSVSTDPLYRLQASAEARATQHQGFDVFTTMSAYQENNVNPPTPHDLLTRHFDVSFISQIMEYSTE